MSSLLYELGLRFAPMLAALSIFLISLPAHALASVAGDGADSQGSEPFKANWGSLGAYQVPGWFRDAKFGIFIHWGVYSVPAFGDEWYPRNMYLAGSPAFQHHVDTYGPQSRFGYKDFIPMFHGEHFDADAWVDLFVRAGARYVVPVAEHCDGFSMYESSINPWNSVAMGPHVDVVGAVEKATRKRGLHFGASSHRAEHWWWYDGGERFNSDVQNPQFKGLYGPAMATRLPFDPGDRRDLDHMDDVKDPDPNHLERWAAPDQVFLDDWLARSTEIVARYHPDLIYFDWWIGQPAFQPYLKRFAAKYYNEGAARKQGVVLTYKEHYFPENAAVLDIERGKLDALRLLPVADRYLGKYQFVGICQRRPVSRREIADRRASGCGEQERQPAPERGTQVRRNHSGGSDDDPVGNRRLVANQW